MSGSNVRFETAVNAVIDSLQPGGYEVVDVFLDSSDVPHVVAARDDELLFVLVQELEGLQPRGFQRRDIVLIHSAARRRNFSGARRGVAKAAD